MTPNICKCVLHSAPVWSVEQELSKKGHFSTGLAICTFTELSRWIKLSFRILVKTYKNVSKSVFN